MFQVAKIPASFFDKECIINFKKMKIEDAIGKIVQEKNDSMAGKEHRRLVAELLFVVR